MELKHLTIIMLACSVLVACDKEEVEPPVELVCVTGTLRCSNTSLHTVQKVLIRSSSATNWTNYGTLDPGESISITLAPGSWDLKFQGLSGGNGCTESSLNIAACQTMGRACSY
jgi:hypothetical protein